MKNEKSIVHHDDSALIVVFLLLSLSPFDSSHLLAFLLPLEVPIVFFVENEGELIPFQE